MASPNTEHDKRVCLGKIASPHGVKGLVKIIPYGEDPSLLGSISPIFTSQDKQDTISILLKNPMGKYMLSEIEGCNSRDGSEALRGTELWVNKSSLPVLDNENEFYIDDLANLTALDKNKENIGMVTAVQNYGAGDLLEIKPSRGPTYFVPFDDIYIIELNIAERFIILQDYEKFRIE